MTCCVVLRSADFGTGGVGERYFFHAFFCQRSVADTSFNGLDVRSYVSLPIIPIELTQI